jgi:hypothetical protein
VAKVEVYQVKIYDAKTDDFVQSKRIATAEGIRIMGGLAVGPAVAIDEADLEPGEPWTPVGYKLAAPSATVERPRLPRAAPFTGHSV